MFNHVAKSGDSSPGGGVKTQTINIPSSSFPSLTDFFDWLDARGGVAEGNQVSVLLASTDGVPLTDSFFWLDKDYSRVDIGPVGVVRSSPVTAISAISGSVGAYSLTFTVQSALTAEQAALHGYVLIETSVAPNSTDVAKTFGYFKVTAVNGSNITVAIPSTTAMAAPTWNANRWIATVFPVVFKGPAFDTSQPWLSLQRSKSPVFRNIGVVGSMGDPGYSANINHQAVKLLDGSEFTTEIDRNPLGATSHAQMVGIHGFHYGITAEGRSKLHGSLAVSGCGGLGISMNGWSEAFFYQLTTTCNGRLQTGAGVQLYGAVFNSSAVGVRPFISAGNSGIGLGALEGSKAICGQGGVLGNGGIDVIADANGQINLPSVSTFAIGAASPAINTAGNWNSYIRRT